MNWKTQSLFISLLSVLSIVLSACGDQEAYVADKVRFRVIFSQEVVQVSFQLNKNYPVKDAKKFTFEKLGSVFLNWNNEMQATELGAQLVASQDSLNQNWPAQDVSSLSNGDDFPESVPEGSLKEWRLKDGGPLEVSLLYQADPQLIAGGAIFSDQFNALPKNFLGTQIFRAANGDAEASISVLGPSKYSKNGAIYFFGNFGTNPFALKKFQGPALDKNNLTGANVDEYTWELTAQSPLQVVRTGFFSFWSRLPSFYESFQNLSYQLNSFQSP